MKLLHERLRCLLDKHEMYDVEGDGYYFGLFGEEAHALADEIERYYIPRPRFEDGEVIENGKPFLADNGKEDIIRHTNIEEDGFWHIYGDWYMAEGDVGEFVKRPTPKVYDADGVEIKVGDVVYEVDDDINSESEEVESIHESTEHPSSWLPQAGKPFVKYKCGGWNYANEVTHERPVFDAEGVRICKGDTVWSTEVLTIKGTVTDIEYKVGDIVNVVIAGSLCEKYNFSPEKLTHREPDSIQKIRDYLIDCGNSDPSGMYYEAADRLTSIMERGA